MAITLLRLGDFTFSVPGLSYDRLSRSYEYRWQPQMRIGSRPAEQYLGPGEETMDFRGVIYPHYAGGYNQLNAMRSAAQIGLPMRLAAAGGGGTFGMNFGLYLGPWCISNIRDEQEYFHKNGDPRKVEFSIDLVHYGLGV